MGIKKETINSIEHTQGHIALNSKNRGQQQSLNKKNLRNIFNQKIIIQELKSCIVLKKGFRNES